MVVTEVAKRRVKNNSAADLTTLDLSHSRHSSAATKQRTISHHIHSVKAACTSCVSIDSPSIAENSVLTAPLRNKPIRSAT